MTTTQVAKMTDVLNIYTLVEKPYAEWTNEEKDFFIRGCVDTHWRNQLCSTIRMHSDRRVKHADPVDHVNGLFDTMLKTNAGVQL